MTMMAIKLKELINSQTSIVPLTVFRIVFGLTMCFASVRFLVKGWVEDLYINSPFRFTYYGFGWVELPSSEVLYGMFFVLVISSLCIAGGLFYRLSCVIYFLVFTYIELLDKSLYLNHYYFVSLVSFLMIFMPANRAYSLDVLRNPEIYTSKVASVFPNIIKLQLTIIYVFAGIAKLNSDWLLDAQPLKIWLSARADMPVLGPFFDWHWFPYIMSWSGMFFDLLIPFFLMWKRSRPFAYLTVIVFHVMTWLLFNIGVFPWVMIACTLIFFSQEEWSWLLKKVKSVHEDKAVESAMVSKPLLILFAVYCLFQLFLPLRHYLYEGNVTWNEQGFRYSWNVMRVEKTGYVEFTCVDPESRKTWKEYPKNYLGSIQEKQMAFQPDMILEFAHFLEKEYGKDIEVYASAYVSLNGSESRELIDSKIDLSKERDSLLGNYSFVRNYSGR